MRVGQHGGVDFKDLVAALQHAESSKMGSTRKAHEEFFSPQGIEYVGVTGDGDKFAIMYVTQWYIDYIASIPCFKDDKAREAWNKAAKECLETGNTVIGNYNE